MGSAGEVIVGRLEGATIPSAHINVLMPDEKRVVVDKSQVTLIKAFKEWGFQPILCAFLSYGPFEGSFHCATSTCAAAVHLQSYF